VVILLSESPPEIVLDLATERIYGCGNYSIVADARTTPDSAIISTPRKQTTTRRRPHRARSRPRIRIPADACQTSTACYAAWRNWSIV